jgi:hypothetical protein
MRVLLDSRMMQLSRTFVFLRFISGEFGFRHVEKPPYPRGGQKLKLASLLF